MVNVKYGKLTYQFISGFNPSNVQFKAYRGLEHSFCLQVRLIFIQQYEVTSHPPPHFPVYRRCLTLNSGYIKSYPHLVGRCRNVSALVLYDIRKKNNTRLANATGKELVILAITCLCWAVAREKVGNYVGSLSGLL